jgi:hypothetical protein
VREENNADVDAMSPSAMRYPASTATVANVDEHPRGCKMVAPPIEKEVIAAAMETKPTHLRLSHQGGTWRGMC